MNPELNDKLQKRVVRSDRMFKVTLIVSILLALSMLAVIVIEGYSTQRQIQAGITQNAATGLANHKKTQAYVKCIAVALTVPLSDRSQLNLDKCTVSADNVENKTDTSNTQTSSTNTSQANSTATSAANPAVAASPAAQTGTTTNPTNQESTDTGVDNAPPGLIPGILDGLRTLLIGEK